MAKIFRFTVPIYLAIQSHDTGYEVIDILRPEILVNRTGTTTRGYKVIDSSYDETKTAVFNDAVVSFWCERYTDRGYAIYKTKLPEDKLDDFEKGTKLTTMLGFKLVHKPVKEKG